MVHQTTRDLHTWGDIVYDVRYPNSTWRPGMPVVSQLPFGNFILTYEFYGAEEADFAVYYRISNSPLTFDEKPGQVLRATDGTVPVGSPYNVWTPEGGPLGTIIVSDGESSEVFLNHNLGAPGSWVKVETPAGASYTRSLMVMPDTSRVMIVAGGVLGGEHNSVLATTIDVTPVGPELAKRKIRGSR